ncbi:hypothetical protein AOLI_G00223950 [Acnodon oligacanthus]
MGEMTERERDEFHYAEERDGRELSCGTGFVNPYLLNEQPLFPAWQLASLPLTLQIPSQPSPRCRALVFGRGSGLLPLTPPVRAVRARPTPLCGFAALTGGLYHCSGLAMGTLCKVIMLIGSGLDKQIEAGGSETDPKLISACLSAQCELIETSARHLK